MLRRYNPLTFSALSLIPLFTQGCLPPFPDKALIENASITVAGTSDTGDTASVQELTLDDILSFSTTFITTAQLYGGEDDFEYGVRVNIDESGDLPLLIQGDFSKIDSGYFALFSEDYSANPFAEGDHTAVFQGLIYYTNPDHQYFGKTLFTSNTLEVPFTLVDNDQEPPVISDVTASPQYTGNDTSITLEATVTDNKGLETVVATLEGVEYPLTDSDQDSIYMAVINPSLLSLTPTTEYTEFSFTVSATDTNENTATSDPVLFSVYDAIAPEVADAGTSTETDNSPSTTWSVYATATDIGTGVESVSVELNDSGVLLPLAYQGSDIYALDLIGDQLSAPSTTYTIHAFDYAGLESTTTGTVSVENITGISINDLVLSTSTVSNASAEYVTITLDAEDLQDAESDLIAYCTVGGTLNVDLAYQSGTQFTGIFETTDFLIAQDYTVSCTVVDTDGYTASRSTALTVTDGLAPDVSCTTTDGTNSSTSPSPLEISCTVDEETGLASSNPVTYSFSLGSGSLTNSSGSTYEASISVEGVAAGSYSIDILAADAAGNTQTYTLNPTVTDATAPTYTSLSASPSSLSNDGSSSFVIYATTVYDETTVAGISVTLDGIEYTLTDADGDLTYESESITPSLWPAASYSIDLTISDGPNETTGSTTVDVTDAVDPTASSCSATTAANDGSIDSTFTAVATDETGLDTSAPISYSASFGSGTLSFSSGSTYTQNVDLSAVAAGTYSVDFTPMDSSGNYGTPCTASFTLLDTSDPAIVCTLASSSIVNGGGSTTLDCVVSEETGISSISYSGYASGGSLTATSSTDYSATLAADSSTAAGTYTIPVTVTDTSSNSDSYTVTLTVTDGTAPTFTSVSATPDSVVDDGTETTQVSVCMDDETTDLNASGGVVITIDSYTETLSYDSGSGCFVSSEINGNQFSAGTYTLAVTAEDAAGNSTTDSSASLEVTCSGVTISSVAASRSTIYNNNSPNTFTISADIAAGSCGGTIDTSSLEVTIDGITESMSLSSGSTYVSGTFDAYDDAMNLGTQTVYVSGADTTGNSITDTSGTVTISDICDNLATDASSATVGIYANGSYETSTSASMDTDIASFSALSVGAFAASYDALVNVNYNGAFAEQLTLDTTNCSGGSLSGSTYTTSSYHDCTLSNTYLGTTYDWSVTAYYISGNYPAFGLTGSAGTSGPFWAQYQTSGGPYYLNNGAGVSTGFSSSSLSTVFVTICGNN